ncbi:hypothetical protein PHYBOEH_005413 [Phytophthora boehmeriae]|uniref:RxLR effector protein n=1 Tax=Phytophthora boehmeriae TaxID=109152 RepID=A0A8T1WLJ3_9STRA|nr:hypothetical protein PHYBOEH_005413 [Phytophthora boehmeriae]
MRLSLMLFATVVVTYFVSCHATVELDQAKTTMMASPDLVRSLENDDTAGRRFLREHKHNKHHEEPETEERGGLPGLSGLQKYISASKVAKEKKAVQNVAEQIVKDPKVIMTIFPVWKKKYSFIDLERLLDLEKNPQFKKIPQDFLFLQKNKKFLRDSKLLA